MALTPADICSLGLVKLGQKPIDDLNGSTANARVAKVIYEPSRDALLEAAPWPFATRRALLGLLTITRTGWAYVYQCPTDMVPGCARYLETGLPNPAPDQQIPFRLEDDATEGAILLTNQQAAELVYTRAVAETVKFTPLFVEALAWKLAYEFTFSIPVKPQVAERMLQQFNLKLAEAIASAFKHQTLSAPARPSAIRARS